MTSSVGGPSVPRKEEDLPLRISTQPGCALAPQGHSLFVVFKNAHFLATDKNLLWAFHSEMLGRKKECEKERNSSQKEGRRERGVQKL